MVAVLLESKVLIPVALRIHKEYRQKTARRDFFPKQRSFKLSDHPRTQRAYWQLRVQRRLVNFKSCQARMSVVSSQQQ